MSRKYWVTVLTARDFSSRCDGRVNYTKDWDIEEPVETFLPSYNKVWRDYLQKQNLTQTIDLCAHPGGPFS